ncbi:hypothetical protein ACTMU2_09315 [Cupriavidus basilensis]
MPSTNAWACRAGRSWRAFGIEFLLLGAAGAVVGVALGYLAHYGLLLSLGGLLQVSLPQPSPLPALVGVLAGLVLLAGFASLPLLALTRVAPLWVLRRDIGAPPVSAWAAYALGLGAFVALLLVAARDLRLVDHGRRVCRRRCSLGCWRRTADAAIARCAAAWPGARPWAGALRWQCWSAAAP